MSKGMKTFLIICAGVFLTGMIAYAIGFGLNGWEGLDRLPGNWHIEKHNGNWKFVHGDEDLIATTLEGEEARFDAIDLNLSFCSVTIKEGGDYRIEVRTDPDFAEPELSVTDGVLVLRDGQGGDVSATDDDNATEVVITMPEGTSLERADLNVSLGLLDIRSLRAADLVLTFDMGEVKARGLIFDNARFDLEICSARIELAGAPEEYDYDIDGGLGSLELDGKDVGDASRDTGAKRYFALSLNLADAEISFL